MSPSAGGPFLPCLVVGFNAGGKLLGRNIATTKPVCQPLPAGIPGLLSVETRGATSNPNSN